MSDNDVERTVGTVDALVLRRLGVKYMLLAAMAEWTTRYLLFAYGTPARSSGCSIWATGSRNTPSAS